MEMEISQVKRSRRKTLAIEINEDGSLIVRSPKNFSSELVYEFVQRKKNWILEKQKLVRKRKKEVSREFTDGESFWYLGRVHRMSVVSDQRAPLVFREKFLLSSRTAGRAKEVFIDWYKEQAQDQIKERVELYTCAAGVKYGKIKITSAKKRWGSCGPSGNLNFSWRLMMTPLKVIDYVVVHEIAHLSLPNHSKDFWAKVEELIPDYSQPKSWLKKNGYLLNF